MTRLEEIMAANKHGEAVHLDRADFDWLCRELQTYNRAIGGIGYALAGMSGTATEILSEICDALCLVTHGQKDEAKAIHAALGDCIDRTEVPF